MVMTFLPSTTRDCDLKRPIVETVGTQKVTLVKSTVFMVEKLKHSSRIGMHSSLLWMRRSAIVYTLDQPMPLN